jgi:hypothetical protein
MRVLFYKIIIENNENSVNLTESKYDTLFEIRNVIKINIS